ncbi:MAG: cellulase family glycosylhydrolase [Planctomycetota bacterium]
MMRIVSCLVVMACAFAGAAAETEKPLGLYVRDGVLLKDGQPYRSIGANYFNLFQRNIQNAQDKSYREKLHALYKAGIPFVRFMCGGYWPVEQKLYLEKKDEFFRRLDDVVQAAEEANVGLIPSLFWHVATAPDIAGEHLDQYGNSGSKTSALLRRYTEEIVGRYKDRAIIWGWEFGNEYNLACDLPNRAQHRPPCWPQLGTPKERTAADELEFPQARAAFVAFAEAVRKLDAARVIISGNAAPRPSAYHNVTERTWKPDTEAQFAEILLRDNPDPINTICVHIYHDKKNGYPGGAQSIEAAVGLANKYAVQAKKPLFLGEFGAEKQLGEKERPVFEEFLAAIEKHQVPLAAFWVFDLESQKQDCNVDFTNERAYMIELVGQANARLQGRRP